MYKFRTGCSQPVNIRGLDYLLTVTSQVRITQVISHIVDFKLDIKEAVEAPRIHWDGDTIQVEPGFAAEAVNALQQLGTVNRWQEKNVYFGGVHAVMPDEGGGGDPRRGGNTLQCTTKS